ncbi:MAG: preprotein translocase subunit SecE [Gammaproteobacteria bacterium]|nr:preprotein translocase subunit SecE [Gammaproteobacteria bacterium]MDH3559904.1 preprotein translocase subunit SecE [Gammaproteobacteria bacterium]
MNAKVDTESRRLDSLKLGAAVLLLCGGVYAFYYFEDQHAVLRVLGILAVAAVALFIAAQTDMGRQVIGFVSGAQTEVRRVVWPTRAETVQTTLAVLFVVLLVGVFLWALDMILLWAVQILTGQGS